jgi:magnesium transporter
MDPDEAADLVADLSDDSREEILGLMEKDEAEEVQELMTYDEDTAGGIMTTEFVAVPASLTAAQTIDRLRDLEPTPRRSTTCTSPIPTSAWSACCRCAT